MGERCAHVGLCLYFELELVLVLYYSVSVSGSAARVGVSVRGNVSVRFSVRLARTTPPRVLGFELLAEGQCLCYS